MPFAFIIVGIILLVSGVRGNSTNLVTLIKGDFSGSNNFIYWMLSILILGGIGYIQDLKTISRAFLWLVIVVLILNEDKNGNGFFTEFQNAIENLTTATDSQGRTTA